MSVESPFHSVRDYFSFIGAKKFYYTQQLDKEFTPSRLERYSQKVLAPFLYPVDKLCENINQPILLAVANVVGVAATTVFFYPNHSFQAIQTACSPFFELEPWMLKFGTYVMAETAITSLMVRTFARLNQTDLLQAWKNREVVPLHFGGQKKANG